MEAKLNLCHLPSDNDDHDTFDDDELCQDTVLRYTSDTDIYVPGELEGGRNCLAIVTPQLTAVTTSGVWLSSPAAPSQAPGPGYYHQSSRVPVTRL